MTETGWFRPRKYRHFDTPVCEKFASRVMQPLFVSEHSFSPLIHYEKVEKRYKYCEKLKKKTIQPKLRPIMYASHRDAAILTFYTDSLNETLERQYSDLHISQNVIAYRSLGKANFDFAAEALQFATQNSPVTILAFDVRGFFDNLDHRLLKSRLKRVLGKGELSDDWYKLFRYTTNFHFVEIDDLKANPTFAARLSERTRDPIASVRELKAEGIPIRGNPNPGKGIPQGTPISAALSNLYMLDFDVAAESHCHRIGALYRRYSDDILIICRPECAVDAEAMIIELITAEQLEINPDKIERSSFEVGGTGTSGGRVAQYLGFNMAESGASIRPSSLSRQWRKMRRAVKRTRKIAESEVAAGRADRAWTKKLRRRFTSLKFRNFSSYARRSARAFGPGERISNQIRRFERAVASELESLRDI
tara:strand:- start:390 stop:1652 length:1263 start_codon:yes stop_codon:yes gene_type:complete